MADLLSTGVSGLLASQANLATTGNNIANASTPGYSRQSVTLAENIPQAGNQSFAIGTGVSVVSVQRAYNQYLTQSVWNANTGLGSATTFNSLASSLNDILSGSGNLQGALDSFYAGVSDVANAPGNTATRQALLGNARSLANVFNTLGQQLNLQQSQVGGQIRDTVTAINSLSGQIADLNKQITQVSNSRNSPNALLDQRDQLVQQLSGLTRISVSRQGNGAIGISIGSGQALVDGARSYDLHASASPYDASRVDVYDNQNNDITGAVSGGTLGGLIRYRGVLDSTQNQIGRSAVALASSVNGQQASGLDLTGNQGQPIFGVTGPAVHAASGNAGTAGVTATISDVAALTGSDYTLAYSGAGNGTDGWVLRNGNGQSVPLSKNPDGTLSAAGLTFSVPGTPADGDSYRVLPTRDAASSLGVSLSDPAGIAAAAALAGSAGSANTGGAQIAAPIVTDPGNASLLSSATITFGAGNAYTISDAAGGTQTGTYTPGQPIQANGWSVSLTGTPASGDSFSVKANSDGLNDNSNALAMARLSDTGVLDGGRTSVTASYADLTASVGAAGRQAQDNLDIQTSLKAQATSAQQSVAGVNLDEEAANLVKFQQAYQASAKIISTAQTMFNSLLNAFPG